MQSSWRVRPTTRFLITLISLALLVATVASAPAGVSAQDNGYKYFPETGHYVQGAFWTYYQSVPDAEIVLGYPVTEQIVREGILIQYFEHMRLELKDGAVSPTPLGRLLYQSAPDIAVNNPSACRLFDTGFTVCYAFLTFFEAHGGERVFGPPISNFQFANGRIVQYFENARLEWRPWLPPGQKVGLANLGLTYFDYLQEDPSLRKAVAPEALVRPISLDVRAFVWRTVTRPSDTQTVYVIVRDQALRPLPGISGTLQIIWPNGQTETRLFQTNDKGFASQTFTFSDLPPGQLVQIQVVVQSGGITGQATTSFRIWH